jgi:hypothetical protein
LDFVARRCEAVSSAVAPPGKRGLIFGEILGRSAGETCTEPTLARFLLPLAARFGVFRTWLVGPDPGASCGLWLAEAAKLGLAKMGDGSGWKTDVLAGLGSDRGRAGIAVFIGATCPFGKLADSGSSKLSICSAGMASCVVAAADRLLFLGEDSFMREAGVAGEGSPGIAGRLDVGLLLLCGRM